MKISAKNKLIKILYTVWTILLMPFLLVWAIVWLSPKQAVKQSAIALNKKFEEINNGGK